MVMKNRYMGSHIKYMSTMNSIRPSPADEATCRHAPSAVYGREQMQVSLSPGAALSSTVQRPTT